MKNIVMYTDGACKPNPGYGGFGVYGYITSLNDKKGKHNKHPHKPLYMTHNEIRSDVETGDEYGSVVESVLEHIGYIDSSKTTNNACELNAVIKALELATEFCKVDKDIKTLNIWTDSNYVVRAVNESLSKWSVNGWRKQDGQVITHVNDWKYLHKLLLDLNENNNVNVYVRWLAGHAGTYGNEMADLFSCIGVNVAKEHCLESGEVKPFINLVTEFKTYKQSFDKKDAINQFKDVFFSPRSPVDEVMYLSNLDKNRLTTKTLFAVNIGEAPKYVNLIKTHVINTIKNPYEFYCVKLSNLDDKDMLRLLTIVPVNYLLEMCKGGFTLCKGDDLVVSRYDADHPDVCDVSYLYTMLFESYKESRLDQFKECLYDVTDVFIKDGSYIIPNNQTHVDLSNSVMNSSLGDRLKQRLLLGVGSDMLNYFSVKCLEKDIVNIEMFVDVDNDTRIATILFIYNCKDRVIISKNNKSVFLVK